jgi:hypothetical protein
MRRRFIIAVFIITAISCERVTPDGILSESEYEKVFIELRILSEYQLISSDSLKARLIADSIFQYYETDAETFKRSHEWYEKDAKNHSRRLSRIADSLSTLDTKISTPTQ